MEHMIVHNKKILHVLTAIGHLKEKTILRNMKQNVALEKMKPKLKIYLV